jgi:phosphatidylglycerophosphatase A
MKTDSIKLAVLTGFGTGRIPRAAGTWGSLLAAVAWVAAALALGENRRPWLDMVFGGLIVLASLACIGWSGWIIQRTGRKDPSEVTIDELAGQWLALLWLPVLPIMPSPWNVLVMAGLQFGLFRLLDITKPGPVRQLEALPAGWGILADDLMAGFLANVAGRVLLLGWLAVKTGINPFETFM